MQVFGIVTDYLGAGFSGTGHRVRVRLDSGEVRDMDADGPLPAGTRVISDGFDDHAVPYRDPTPPRRFTIPAKGQPHGVRVADRPAHFQSVSVADLGALPLGVTSEPFPGVRIQRYADRYEVEINGQMLGSYDAPSLAQELMERGYYRAPGATLKFNWLGDAFDCNQNTNINWRAEAPPTKYASSALRSPAMRREERALAQKFREAGKPAKFAIYPASQIATLTEAQILESLTGITEMYRGLSPDMRDGSAIWRDVEPYAAELKRRGMPGGIYDQLQRQLAPTVWQSIKGLFGYTEQAPEAGAKKFSLGLEPDPSTNRGMLGVVTRSRSDLRMILGTMNPGDWQYVNQRVMAVRNAMGWTLTDEASKDERSYDSLDATVNALASQLGFTEAAARR